MDVTTIDLLRHGAVGGGDCFRGATDDPLSPEGREQMWRAVTGTSPWQRLISSPLRRCADFSGPFATERQLPLAYDNQLREIDFGDWEGRTSNEIHAQTPELLAAFYRDPLQHPPPQGESLTLFQSRVVAALEKYSIQHVGEHLLMVSHGGVIRIILAHVLSLPLHALLRIEVPYAALSRITLGVAEGAVVSRALLFHNRSSG